MQLVDCFCAPFVWHFSIAGFPIFRRVGGICWKGGGVTMFKRICRMHATSPSTQTHTHTLIEPILASFSSFLCATSIYFCLNIYKLQKKNSCNYIRAVFFYSCNCICIYMCICSCICICASVLGANVSDGVRVSCMCIICAWLPLGLCIANNANERIST